MTDETRIAEIRERVLAARSMGYFHTRDDVSFLLAQLEAAQGRVVCLEKALADSMKTAHEARVLYEGMGTGFGNKMAEWAAQQKGRADQAEKSLAEALERVKELEKLSVRFNDYTHFGCGHVVGKPWPGPNCPICAELIEIGKARDSALAEAKGYREAVEAWKEMCTWASCAPILRWDTREPLAGREKERCPRCNKVYQKMLALSSPAQPLKEREAR